MQKRSILKVALVYLIIFLLFSLGFMWANQYKEYVGFLMGLCILTVIMIVNISVALINFKSQKQSEKENEKEAIEEAMQIAKALKNIVERAVLIDLEKEKYSYMRQWLKSDPIPLYGQYDRFKNYMLSIISSEEEKNSTESVIRLENLKKHFSNEGDEIRFVIQIKSDSGCEWKNVYIKCVERKENIPTKAMFLRVDITNQMEKQKKNEMVLKDALYMAQSANKAKATFLSNMSHDIRTPMNAIMGFVTLIKKNVDDKESVVEYLDKISTSSEHLLSLINDMLDMSRVENGNVQLEEGFWNLEEIADEVYSIIHAHAGEKNIDFKIHTDIVHKYVFCDKMRLIQMLINLLTNPVKYSKHGGFASLAIIEGESANDNVGRYVIKIKENNCGMTEELQKGNGLGLAITKNIVDMMGGNIEVFSEINEGNEVKISVDFKLASRMDERSDSNVENEKEYDFSGRRVLLVEDNEINAEIATELLEDTGMQVELAINGREAVEKFELSEERYYDVILMDILMPIMDGYEATQVIRKMNRKDRNVPIIALSANTFEEDVRKSTDSGMNAHIAKPIIVDVLFGKIKELI